MADMFGFGSKKIPGYHSGTISTLSPEQQALFSQLLGGIKGGLGGGLEHLSKLASGDQSYFGELEAPALRQFGGLQGQLASRFSGMGTGARKSSGFGLATSSAAQQLSENLQSQRMGLQQKAIQDLLGIGQSLLGTKTQEPYLMQKQLPAWKQLLLGLSPAFSQGAGMALGGLF